MGSGENRLLPAWSSGSGARSILDLHQWLRYWLTAFYMAGLIDTEKTVSTLMERFILRPKTKRRHLLVFLHHSMLSRPDLSQKASTAVWMRICK